MLKFGDLKYAYPDPHVCYFYVAQNFLYLKLKFCTFMGKFIIYAMTFFLIFLKHINVFFIFSKVAGALVPRSTKSLSDGTALVLSQLGTWEFWDSTEVGTGMMVRRPISSYRNR
jgi:hypothetical protein